MKKEPILQYIEDVKTLNNRDATNAELEDIKKRRSSPKRRDFYEEFKKTGKLPVPTKEEIESVRANQRVRDYMLRKDKPKPTSPVEIDFSLPPMQTAGLWSDIKNSSIYKLLDNPKVMGVELGHETIMETINLLQNSGLLKKGGRVK